jgi:hypothetical protein
MTRRTERLRYRLARVLPPGAVLKLQSRPRFPALVRRARPVRWGNLRRTNPLDDSGGQGRGTTIHRYYAARFIEGQGKLGKGRILEFREARYGAHLGYEPANVDVVDIVPENDTATIIADLGDERSLPANTFECILLVDGLRFVRNLETAILNARQSLTRDGLLLLCLPVLEPVRNDALGPDRWRVLPPMLGDILEQTCPAADVTVETYGNLLTATATLAGLAAEELSSEELEFRDDRYPVLVAASVRGGLSPGGNPLR